MHEQSRTRIRPLRKAADANSCACNNESAEDFAPQPAPANTGHRFADLNVSEPEDPLEQEADRIADEVMRRSVAHPRVQRAAVAAPDSVQRKCAECEQEEKQEQENEKKDERDQKLQRKADEPRRDFEEGGGPRRLIPDGGQPLDREARDFLEPRFGFDFRDVRVHTGKQASAAAESVNAKAYTIGHDVVFGDSQYAPRTTDGLRLIAHELAHVTQSGNANVIRRSPEQSDDAPEPLDARNGGSTTLQDPPAFQMKEIRGATIADAAAALPAEAGTVEFDFEVASSGDPIKQADLKVKQTLTMPKWMERDQQCLPVQRSWDRFYNALRAHEDGHLALDKQLFANAHRRFIGKALSDIDAVSTQLRADVKAKQDDYDAQTDHGRNGTPPTLLDTSVNCDGKEAQNEGESESAQEVAAQPIPDGEPKDNTVRLAGGATPAPAGTPPGTTSTDKSTPSGLETIAEDLLFQVKDKSAHREQILQNMVRVGKMATGGQKRGELERAYKDKSADKSADLTSDLKSNVVSNALTTWSKHDFIRSQRYLDYGELRPVDKIYFAAEGAGTDWPTIERLLPEISKDMITNEARFSLDYSSDYPATARLPNGQQSHIGGMIDDEFPSGNDAPEAIKGKAVLAFGEPQPLDLIRAATSAETLFHPLQQARQSFESVAILQKRYQERYPESLLQKHIESQVSGDDIKRARMILDGTFTARNRIKLAMGMGVDPDEKEIWAALEEATPKELEELRNEYKDKGDIYKMFQGDWLRGLSKENLMRAEAMLGAGPAGEDPVLTKLKAQGGVNGEEIVNVIKKALANDWKSYHDAYNDGNGALRKFADERLDAGQKGNVASYLQDKPLDRIKYGIDRIDLEYVMLQLTAFASPDDKRAMMDDTALLGKIDSSFGAKDANKIRDTLVPANISPEERAKLLTDKIKRESSTLLGWSSSAEALDDEQRELLITLENAKADGKLTPEEQAKIDALNKRTESALSAYIGVRDELNGYLQTALDVAVSLAATIGTGGAGAALLASAVARVALTQAVLSVAVKKIVEGDNFDVLSPQAAGVFLGGFVDGAMNAVGGPAAKAAVGAALRDSARVAAMEAGGVVFNGSGRKILTRAAEGVITNSPGAMVRSAADDETWKDGFTKGFEKVVVSGAEAGALGAVTQVGTGALHDAVKLGMGADGIEHHLGFNSEGELTRCSPSCPIYVASVKGRLETFKAESKLVLSSRLEGDIVAMEQAAQVLTDEARGLKTLTGAEAATKKNTVMLGAAELEQKVMQMEKADKTLRQILDSRGPVTIRDLDLETMNLLRRIYGDGLAAGLHSKETIASYEALFAAVSGLGGDYQAHHIVEQQVLKLLGHDVGLCPAIILTREEHQAITSRLAQFLPPNEVKFSDLTKREILEAYEQAYAAHPRWMAEVRPYFK